MDGSRTIAASAALIMATTGAGAEPLPTQHFLPLTVAKDRLQ